MEFTPNTSKIIKNRPKIIKRLTDVENNRQVVVEGQLNLRFERLNLHLARAMRIEIIKANLADSNRFAHKLCDFIPAVFGFVRMYANGRENMVVLSRKSYRLA